MTVELLTLARPHTDDAVEVVEERVDPRDALALLSRRWRVVHDTPWPKRSGSLIDHIVVGPAGLVAIVVGDSPAQALAAAATLSGLVPGLPHSYVHAVLVVDDAQAPVMDFEGVTRCEAADLPALLGSLPKVLRGEEAVGVLGVLYVGLERAEQAEKAKQAALAEAARAEEAAASGLVNVVEPAHRRHRSWLGARAS